MCGKMKIAGVSAGVALAACVLEPCAFADDAVGVMRVDAGTSGFAEAEMPFAPMSDIGPLGYVSGLFCGDGGEFSDRLYRRDSATGEITNAVWSASAWLDPATLLPSFMQALPGDTLYFVRTDAGQFDFSAFGRLAALSSPSNGLAFSSLSVDPACETVSFGVSPSPSPYDLLSSQGTNAAAAAASAWLHLAHVPASSAFSRTDPLPLPGFTRLYMVSSSAVDTDGDGLSDALEAHVYGTSPNLPDTDGDGIPDGREVACGSNPLVPDPQSSIPGLRAEFRLTPGDISDIPDFSALEPLAVAVASTVAYADGSWPAAVEQRGDHFACRITGFVFAPVAGKYTFYVTSDDGSRLVVDGTRVVYSPGSHGALEKHGTIMLEAGWHPLELAYYENSVSAVLSMAWKCPGGSKTAIPASSLCHVPENLAPVASLSASAGPYVEGQTVVLYASVRDVDGEIASASLYDGDALLCAIEGGSHSLSVQGISPGVHSFRVVAADDLGATNECSLAVEVEGLPSSYATGLVSAYYSFSSALSSMPDVSGMTPVATGIVRRIYYPLSASAWEDAPEGLANRYAAVYSGALMVREPGIYTIALRSDDGSRLILDGSTAVDNDGSHSLTKVSASLPLSAGLHELRLDYFENIGDAGLELSWTRPDGVSEIIPPACLFHPVGTVDSDSDGMPDWWEEKFALDPADPSDASLDADGDGITNLAEYNAGTNPRSPDTDSDGMPDAWELAHGLCPFADDALGDADSDGLRNAEEMHLGTDPHLSDSDGDGLTDYEEGRQLGTDPLSVDAISQGAPLSVSVDGRTVSFSVAEPRAYAVTASFLNEWRDYGKVKRQPPPANRAVFRVDGHFVAFRDFAFDCSNAVQVVFYTPVLPAGGHSVSFEWCSPDFRVRTALAGVSVRAVAGIDLAAVVRRRNAVVTDTFSSRVSPAFIEGESVFPWLVSADVCDVRPGVADSWYMDLPLSPTGAVSAVVSFEGAVATNLTATWTPTDLFSVTDDIVIRAGDSMLFAGHPVQAADGAVDVFTNGVLACNYPFGSCAVVQFGRSGDYAVHAVWRNAAGSDEAASAVMSVSCVGGAFPSARPACVVGASRQWWCHGLPTNAVFQTDAFTHFRLAGDGLAGLLVDDTRGERRIAARLSDGGPVVDVATVDPMWAVSSFGNVAYLMESGDDFDRCRCYLRQYGATGSVSFRIRAYSSSVLLDDYSTSRNVGVGAFDVDGILWTDILKSKSTASPCHTVDVFQDGIKIGEAVYGNGTLPEELR